MSRHPSLTQRVGVWTTLLILSIIIQTGQGIGTDKGERPVILDSSERFKPEYSETVSGEADPDNPFRVSINIRDDKTACARIFAYGSYGQNWTLTAGKTTPIIEDPYMQQVSGGTFPLVVTLRDQTGSWVVVPPGPYTVEITPESRSGTATIQVLFVYLPENMDRGTLQDQEVSVRNITIPSGLKEVIFMTESVFGTDLDLYIHKGENRPVRMTDFTWNATRPCTNCGLEGVDNYLSELLVIKNPDPGQYLMMTRASGGEDYFFTYWMGIEENQTSEQNIQEITEGLPPRYGV